MIPSTTTVELVDNMPALSEHAFKVGDATWMMQAASKLYSDTAMAVVREYSTNARDANIEAGNADKPIIVTRPTMDEPVLKIRDFGPGMSLETLTDVYINFGVSTKRNSNDANGMLGFGSKSAAAYTNSYTVVSIHNGRKIVAVVNRDPSSFLKMKIVLDVETDEPSGVEIQIPVSNRDLINKKIDLFFSYWEQGTFEVSGHEVTLFTFDEEAGQWNDNTFFFTPKSHTSHVVMGGVAYPISNAQRLWTHGVDARSFVAYIPMGAVEFVPSREALEYSDKTKSYLEMLVESVSKEIKGAYTKEINSCKSHVEARKAHLKWSGILRSTTRPVFKGETLPERLSFNDEKPTQWNSHSYRYSTQYNITHSYCNYQTVSFVTNAPQNISASVKNTTKKYFKHLGLKLDSVLFFTGDYKNPWFADKIFDYQEMKKVVKDAYPAPPKTTTSYGPVKDIAGSFDVMGLVNGKFSITEEIMSGDVVYLTSQEKNSFDLIEEWMKELKIDKVWVVPQNRLSKVQRLHKTTSFMSLVKKNAKTSYEDIYTKEELTGLAYQKCLSYAWSKVLNAGLDIKDKRVQALAKAIQSVPEDRSWLHKATASRLHLAFNHNLPAVANIGDILDKDYPAAAYLAARDTKHLVKYMNLMYDEYMKEGRL